MIKNKMKKTKLAFLLIVGMLAGSMPMQAYAASADSVPTEPAAAQVQPVQTTEPAAAPVQTTDSEEAEWTAETMEYIRQAREELAGLTEQQPVLALVYLSDTYPVRAAASYDSDVVVSVPSGQSVVIKDVEIVFTEEAYEAWSYVSLYYNDREYEGYIPRDFLACGDERFLQWESEYNMNPGAMAMYAINEAALNENGVFPDVAQFPASYQASLQALKQAHPNWTFVAMNTGLDWNTVIANEIGGGKSLIYKTFGDWTKEGSYDNANWYYASEEILRYYMDPRNALTESNIFQFEHLIYNENNHTQAALDVFLNSTFMNGSQNAPGTDLTFSTILWAVGREQKVSPYHLAARVYQEQGRADNPMISGTYPGFEGYYNYFNIGATGNSNQQYIVNGLTYARNKGWNNAYEAIRGGTMILAANYIHRGQDTLYLQKFNVTTNNTFGHQYMQNITAPTTEGQKMRKIYSDAGAMDSPFVFRIPVYLNMPETASPMPTSSTNVVLQVPAGYDATVYLDGVAYAPAARNGRVIVKAPDHTAKTAVVYSYNASGVPTGMYLWTLDYRNNAYVATPQPQMENLLTYHGFSIRITGKSGIRFKTGIAADVRNTLLTEGIGGYTLKEYGTLVMNNANRGQYPMIRGGEKVLAGVSYGIDTSGAWVDKVYETVDGRHRFTSVLVGLPPEQYKTEFAFRGYAVLEKDGVQTVVYGPVVARSIYNLAETVLRAGLYPEGSSAEAFLEQLISDAK